MCQQIRWQRNPPRIPHSWAITALARPPEKVKKASPNLTGERAVLRLRLHAAGTKKSPAGQGPRGAGWRRPTLPPIAGSTIGAGGLNCSVRDGKRWGPAAVAAMPIARHGRGRTAARQGEGGREGGEGDRAGPARGGGAPPAPAPRPAGSPRAISTGRPRRRRRSTSGLSTWSSPTALTGGLISGGASRLDAFSAYPARARLPGGGPGGPAGAPAARPARSSRTSASAPQASHARSR